MSQKNPPTKRTERDWTLAFNGMSSGVVLAALLGAIAHSAGLDRQEVASAPFHDRLLAGPVLPPIPPAPLWQPVDLSTMPVEPVEPEVPVAPWSTTPQPTQFAVVRKSGGIGFMGPVSGPLNTTLGPLGPVSGPQWTRNALPYIGQQVPQPVGSAAPAASPRLPSEASSELPDLRKLELSRLAHPDLQVRGNQPASPARGVEVSAQQPLSVSLSVVRPPKGYQVGDPVAVRMTANADCNVALLRVDASGKSTTLFRSPGASRRFACALRAGPASGAEYLVVIASVRPLDGADAASALRTSGAGFTAVPAVGEGTGPGQAWTLAVSQASALGGAASHWERHEWSVATAAFLTRPAVSTAKRASPPVPSVVPKQASNAPAPAAPEGSQLPGGTASKLPGAPGNAPVSRPKPDMAPAAQPAEASPKANATPKTDAVPGDTSSEGPADGSQR